MARTTRKAAANTRPAHSNLHGVARRRPLRHALLAGTALCCVGLALVPRLALALPQNGQVVQGVAQIIVKSPTEIVVNQSSAKVVIDWASFNIAANEKVVFVQMDQLAQALNRVLGGGASQILGQLSANGVVMLSNPNGILFGPGSNVNVQAIIATTAGMSSSAQAAFMAGAKANFDIASTSPTASVVNRGTITAGQAGLVGLVAPGVENSGLIQAKLGKVQLVSGNTFTLDLYGDKLIKVAVSDKVLSQVTTADGQPLAALVSNSGTIEADGGTIILTANAARDIVSTVINMTGVARARSVGTSNGEIVLDGGESGIVQVAGTLDASGREAGQTGGTAKMLGEKVALAEGARIDVVGDAGGGVALVGGNWQGKGPERNAARTYVAASAVISADAVSTGDGGKVVVWADDITRFNGSISVTGGKLGGNGGRVEVSGNGWLDFHGKVDTRAVLGNGGSLLLDPTNIIVATADPGGGAVSQTTAASVDQFADNAAETSWVTPTDLVTLLNSAAVTLQAANDITVSNAINASGNSGNYGLTLTAGRTITINDDITLRGAFTATANDTGNGGTNRGAGAADFTMASGKTINTSSRNGGINIAISTQGTAGTAMIDHLSSGSGNIIIFTDSITLNGGANSINGTGGLGLYTKTTSRPVVIGAAGTASDFGLDATELTTIASGFSGIYIGNSGGASGTGGVTMSGVLAFNNANVEIYSNGTGGFITLDSTAAVSVSGNSHLYFFAGSGNSGTFTLANGATISAGSGTIQIAADSIALNGAANSISGAGSLKLLNQTGSRPIVIGAAGTISDFALDTAEIAAISGGFGSISIGQQYGTGGVTMSGTLAFNADTNIYNQGIGGAVTLDSTVAITTNSKSLSFYAGSGNSGTFTQANGATISAGSGAIAIFADSIALSGAANSISGTNYIALIPNTSARPIVIGAAGTATDFALNATALATMASGFSTIQVGMNTNSGGITVSGQAAFYSPVTFYQSSSGLFTVDSIISSSGLVSFSGASTTLNSSVYGTGGVSFGGAVNVGANNLVVNAHSGTATFSSTVSHGTNTFTVNADDVALSGNWIGTGARILQLYTLSRTIGLAGGTGNFALSATELGYLKNDSPSSVTIGNADGSGTLTGGAFSFDDALILRAGGFAQTGIWTLTGGLTLTGGAASTDIALASYANDITGGVTFGSTQSNIRDVALRNVNAAAAVPDFSATSNLRSLTLTYNNAAVQVPNITLASGGNLSVTAGGAITQAAGGIVVPGTASFTAGANAITLADAANNFTGAVSLSNSGANNVSLRDTNALDLGTVGVGSGTLTIQAGGDITQTGILTVSGTSSFTAGAHQITLASASNDFTGAVSLSNSGANNVSLRDINSLDLGTVSVGSGTLTIQAGAGISQSGAITQASGGGAVSVTSTGGLTHVSSIILANASNDFTGAVSLSTSGSDNVSIRDTNALALGTVGVGSGTLSITAGGTLSQTGAITQAAGGGAVTITATAAGSDIGLASAANDFTGTVGFGGTTFNIRDFALRNTNASASVPNFTGLTNLRSLTLAFDNAAIALPALTLASGGNLSVTAGGTITQTGAMVVPGTTILASGSANDITLTTSGNSFTGNVSITSGKNVSLTAGTVPTMGSYTVSKLTLNGTQIYPVVAVASSNNSATNGTINTIANNQVPMLMNAANGSGPAASASFVVSGAGPMAPAQASFATRPLGSGYTVDVFKSDFKVVSVSPEMGAIMPNANAAAPSVWGSGTTTGSTSPTGTTGTTGSVDGNENRL